MRKKELVFVLISILFATVSSFLIYNLRVILVYLVDINIGPFKQPNVARCICYFLFSYLLKYSEISFIRKLIYLALPAILLDTTTIFFGPQLMPLRFPYLTLYPLIGIVCGLLLQISSRRFFYSLIGAVIFIIASELWFIPEILWFMHKTKETDTVISSKKILLDTYIGINKNPVKLNDTLKSKVALLEFYFVGCPPCEDKFDYLKILVDEYSDKGFSVVLICDGIASSYNQFLDHWNKYKYKNIIFLYDTDKTISKYRIDGFPTEFLVSSGNIHYREKGFGKSIATKWLETERIKIQSLLKNTVK